MILMNCHTHLFLLCFVLRLGGLERARRKHLKEAYSTSFFNYSELFSTSYGHKCFKKSIMISRNSLSCKVKPKVLLIKRGQVTDNTASNKR